MTCVFGEQLWPANDLRLPWLYKTLGWIGRKLEETVWRKKKEL